MFFYDRGRRPRLNVDAKERGFPTMDALNAIFSRRSIRLYTSKQVSRDALTDILKAGMCGPSAGNERPWHFIVLTDRAILDEIPKFHPFAAMLKHATIAVLVCGDTRLEKQRGCWVLDCAVATQNMLLAAHAKGLGAVWCGVYPDEDRAAKLKKLLNLPEHVNPFSLVPLGFPAEAKQSTDRFDATRLHENRW